jgi:hypothetical protein
MLVPNRRLDYRGHQYGGTIKGQKPKKFGPTMEKRKIDA